MAAPSTVVGPAARPETPRVRFAPDVWQAPLLPAALAYTAGIVVDRYGSVPLNLSLLATLVALAAWAVSLQTSRTGLPLVYLGVAAAALGAARHHAHRDIYPADDIGSLASGEPRPIRLEGVLLEEPATRWHLPDDPLHSIQSTDPSESVLEAARVRRGDGWVAASGKARLVIDGSLHGLHVGDQVEVVGRIEAPQPPFNPGEADNASALRDQRIRAVVRALKTTEAVSRRAEGWQGSIRRILAISAEKGRQSLEAALPPEQAGLAQALLLGEGSHTTTQDWTRYLETGVVHVLVISGQHLVILAGFLWIVMRAIGVRRRRGALVVALFLIIYALLTGGRPPAARAAVMGSAACGAILMRRVSLPTNLLALAWLVLLIHNPADAFDAGCLLSFLAVGVLYWRPERTPGDSPDPVEQLVDAMRPAWWRGVRSISRRTTRAYALSAWVWLAAAPLVAARYHLVSPIGLLLAPPAVLLTTVTLIAGFLFLIVCGWCAPAAAALGWITGGSLWATDTLVRWAQGVPGGHWYVADVPVWWLAGFYCGLFAWLLLQPLRRHARWTIVTAGVWLAIGAAAYFGKTAPDGLRCTFLAVGHGGCTVIETSDGRVLLYDAGSLAGPEVTRRQIAPFLWHRGVRRLDEIFLSHADLDHFNGIVSLLDRFSVGQVTCTPTFASKTTPGVAVTLEALTRAQIPIRIVHAGDRLSAADVTLDVLHPPPLGPDGNENARSMVLLVCHAGHSILLTGDLEGPGLGRVLRLAKPKVDVLMSPHHGSRTANTPSLAAWANPKLVVSCQGPPRNPAAPDPYTSRGLRLWPTWPHGAVTILSSRTVLTVETFRSHRKVTLCGSAARYP